MQRLTDEQRRRVEENLQLVTYTMKRHIQYVSSEDWDDVFQEGAIGLCKAAATYDPEKGIRFATFAIPCIVNEIHMYMRRQNTKRRRLERDALRFEDFACEERSEKMRIGNLIAAVEDVESALDLILLTDFIRNGLTEREKKVVTMLLDGKRQEDIAGAIGLTQSYVSRIVKRIEKRVHLFRMGYPKCAAS